MQMINRQSLIRGVGKVCDAMMLMIAGAWLLATYLTYANPQFAPALNGIGAGLPIAFWTFYLLSSFLRPKVDTPSPGDPSPRWSGVAVVVATGSAGVIFMARSSSPTNYVILPAIVVGTLVIAALVWRFATNHAAEIGEARFVSNGSR
jgi:type II secretory pathway component PulF